MSKKKEEQEEGMLKVQELIAGGASEFKLKLVTSRPNDIIKQ